MNNLDTTKCMPIDNERMNAFLTEQVGESAGFTQEWALIEGKGLICTELVGREFTKGLITLEIQKIKPNVIQLFPSWEAKFSEEELKEYSKAPITVGEFVKARRGYNSRLEANEWRINEWLNS